MGGLEWWHIVIIVAALFVLFGYKKLPSATKSIAQSMKIFRDETKGLMHSDDHEQDTPVVEHRAGANTGAGALAAPSLTKAAEPVAQPVAQPAAVTVPAPVVAPAPVAAPPAAPEAAPSLAPRPKAYAAGDQQPR